MSYLDERARRVISANDAQGKSYITKDEFTDTREALPAFVLNDLWRSDSLPVKMTDDDTLTGTVVNSPPPAGLVVRIVTFPPESAIEESAYNASFDKFHGMESGSEDGAKGMHGTLAVDIVTILSGEMHCIFESGEETLLRTGDTIINRGTKHVWSVRGTEPCTVVATVLSTDVLAESLVSTAEPS